MSLSTRLEVATLAHDLGWIAVSFGFGSIFDVLGVTWLISLPIILAYIVAVFRWVWPWTRQKVTDLVVRHWIRQQPKEQQYLLFLHYEFGRGR